MPVLAEILRAEPNSASLTAEQLYERFREPGPAYRGKPFWSWNGRLNKDELIRQIHVLKEMGFGGFFMHSRTGLATEYLGDEWFELTNVCADEAAKLGMEAWLYDEDRWPSGTAGGLVTKRPEFRLKYMKLRTVPAAQFGWHDGIYAAFSCDLDGINFSQCRRITNDTPSSEYVNKTILVFSIEEMAKGSFYNGYTYADTMNREATDYFLQLTHEQYKARCGDRLGGLDPRDLHRRAAPRGRHVRVQPAQPGQHVDDALDRQAARGVRATRRLRSRGASAVSVPSRRRRSPCRRPSTTIWTSASSSSSRIGPSRSTTGAAQNNLLFTGHVLHEDTLTAQTTMQGSLMRFYEYMHYPGVDVLTEGNRNYWIVKQLSSAARQLGRKWLLSELYGVTGWQFDFEAHKAVGDWQALFGINLRCPHLAWYTMEGEAKRDYPASIFYQSGWWRDYAPVETYFARLGLMLQQGRPYCDLLVINPVESLWCQIHVDWTQNIATPKDAAVQEIETGVPRPVPLARRRHRSISITATRR